nr:MAG TPA: hypothetical protein [Caudoviricetes sp.]
MIVILGRDLITKNKKFGIASACKKFKINI